MTEDTVTDAQWETAALEQLRADIRAYPGGIAGFAEDHRARIGVRKNALADNLNGTAKISYRTFTRSVRILGFDLDTYNARIQQRLDAAAGRALLG